MRKNGKKVPKQKLDTNTNNLHFMKHKFSFSEDSTKHPKHAGIRIRIEWRVVGRVGRYLLCLNKLNN
jgi:hypothetical protein